jgi:hypothetical protein
MFFYLWLFIKFRNLRIKAEFIYLFFIHILTILTLLIYYRIPHLHTINNFRSSIKEPGRFLFVKLALITTINTYPATIILVLEMINYQISLHFNIGFLVSRKREFIV